MFAGMQAFGAAGTYGGGLSNGGPPSNASMGGVAPPPPPATLTAVMRGYGGYGGGPTAGMFGETMAARAAVGGQMAMGVAGMGMAGLGAAGSLGLIGGGFGAAASLMDPMGLAMRAGAGAFGMAGGGMGGLAAGGLAAGGVMLPMYAASAWAGGIANNFRGGMQDQMALNSTLRQNFNFMGGQGAYGRGFSQGQMGQIGGMVAGEMRSNVFTSAGEMNSVIAGGAQMGAFTGVRDVQEFSKKFREMLTTLKSVQRELGGNLTEAMEFVNQSRQAGIFGSTAATRFAGTIRTVSAASGMDQGQLIQLAANGAQISRAFGGRGEQGAIGALRGVSTMSAAMAGGHVNEAMLSEATGGRTGQDAMSTFVTDMMAQSGQFSRRAAGRYSIFGLANSSGRGLDQAATMDFVSGDMSVGDLSRRAHRQVGRMGRASAINREGLLRGALMEEGGMAGQIGMMRMIVGDRAMDQGDDMMSLVMQRRLHMSRPQAEIMTSLMRNQGAIAAREAGDSANSSREALLRTDIRENRSLESLTRHIEHSVQDSTGMLRARDMGRTLVTRLSGIAERVMNDLLGISSEQMTTEGQASMARLRQGNASAADFRNMGMGSGMTGSLNIDRQGLLEHGGSVGARLRARGMDTGGVNTYAGVSAMLQRAQAADMGILTGGSGRFDESYRLGEMNLDVAGNQSNILSARLAAMGTGNADDVYRFAGGSGNATAAFMAQQGIVNNARADGMGRLLGRGGGGISMGSIGEHIMTAVRGAGQFWTGGGTGGGDALRDTVLSQAVLGPRTDALDFIASGGHYARRTQGAMTEVGEQRRAMIEGMGGVSREHLQQLQGNSEFMTRMRAVTGATSEEARTEAMSRLIAYTNTQDASAGGGAQFRAMASVVTQTRESMLRNGGRAGSEIMSFTRDDAAMRAAAQARQEYAGHMIGMGSLSQGRLGGAIRRMGEVVGAGAGPEEGLAAQSDLRRTALAMTDEEFRAEANTMMDAQSFGSEAERESVRAQRRATLLGLSRQRAVDRDLQGRGRRRGRGAAETAIGEMTGYGTGDMEFQIHGRTLRGQAGRTALQRALEGRAGADGDEILNQFQAQATDPQGMGLSAGRAEEMRMLLQAGNRNRGRDGSFSEKDREAMHEFTQLDDVQNAMRDATRRRSENALSSAAGRDPVGARQIQLLESINTGISRMAPASADAAPNMSTDRNQSGG